MILGIGTDIIDINRIKNTINKYGKRFKKRCFTKKEIMKAEKSYNPDHSYAKRYAAKEACSKALGTGFRKGVFWRDMGVINLPSGKPTMTLKGGALKRLREITPKGLVAQIDLTITDELPMAGALVIISAIPAQNING